MVVVLENWDVDRLFLFLTKALDSSDSYASLLAATVLLLQCTVLGGLEDGDLTDLLSLLSPLLIPRSR